MSRWALVVVVLALVAGLPGFTGIAGGPLYVARSLFSVFLVTFLVGLAFSQITRGRSEGGCA